MASEAPQQSLPVLYEGLEPISKEKHGDLKIDNIDGPAIMSKVHAVPVTVEEFPMLQRHYPVVFSAGDNPVPLALMGLHEGVNAFVNDKGRLDDDFLYIPAYIRRYPFMLARLTKDAEDLSLCVDPTSGAIGDKGHALFENDEPSEATKRVMQFCEQFEMGAQRTAMFMKELKELDLLMEGEVSIQPEGLEQPFVYRGFQMVDEKKFSELSGDKLRKMNQNGMLPVILAHLLSLAQIREIFQRQMKLGKGPKELTEMMEKANKAKADA